MIGFLSGFAQDKMPIKAHGNFNTKEVKHPFALQMKTIPASTNHSASVYWSDDFSNPATWVFDHDPATSTDWSIGNNPPVQGFPREIKSQTVLNGYAIFDSFGLCDPANGQIGSMTMTSPANLTGHNYVRLKFSQYYYRFKDSTFVYVSTNGNTWTKFPLNLTVDSFAFNSISGAVNASIEYLDISSVAANQDSVYIRFEFYSPLSLNPDGCGGGWMIDDVSLEDYPAIDATPDLAFGGEYSVIPIIQPESFKLRGKVRNVGRTSFTGAKIFFDVKNGLGNTIYQDSSNASLTVAPGDTSVYLNSSSPFIPVATGEYYIDQKVVVPGDSDITNDSTFDFNRGQLFVDDSLYSRDYVFWTSTAYFGAYGYNNGTGSFGSIFNVYHASQFSSASIYLSSPTLGDHVSISVYDVNGGVPNTLIGSTAIYTITAGDTAGNEITLPFAPWVNVGVGDYFVAVNQLDPRNLSLRFSDLIFTKQKNFLKSTSVWRTFESQGLNATPYIFVNNPSGTLLNVKDNKVGSSSFEVFPNPSNGKVFFTNKSGLNEKNVLINVLNNLGAIVKTASFDFVSHGNIDLSSFPAGVYTLNIVTATGQENKTIVLQ